MASKDEVLNAVLGVLENQMAGSAKDYYREYMDSELSALEWGDTTPSPPPGTKPQFSLDHPHGHQLRDGRKAEVWKVAEGKIWGRFNRYDDVWLATSWDLNGRVGEGQESPTDLINAPDPTPRVYAKKWLNFYADGEIGKALYSSKKEAAEGASVLSTITRIGIPVEVREIVEGDE